MCRFRSLQRDQNRPQHSINDEFDQYKRTLVNGLELTRGRLPLWLKVGARVVVCKILLLCARRGNNEETRVFVWPLCVFFLGCTISDFQSGGSTYFTGVLIVNTPISKIPMLGSTNRGHS